MNETLQVVCPSCAAINRVPNARLQEAPVCGRCQTQLFAGRPLDVDEQAFERHVAKSELPVLVDFWAPWCGPCRMMAPAYEQAAQSLEPFVRVLKLDTEGSPNLSARLGIRSIPTLALFKDGRELARQAGAMDARGIVAWVQAQLGHGR